MNQRSCQRYITDIGFRCRTCMVCSGSRKRSSKRSCSANRNSFSGECKHPVYFNVKRHCFRFIIFSAMTEKIENSKFYPLTMELCQPPHQYVLSLLLSLLTLMQYA